MEAIKMIAILGFPVLTFLFFGFLLKEVKSAIWLAPWPEEKKKRIMTRTRIGLVLWAISVSMASLLGYTTNFKIFPLNVMSLLLIPLIITIILLLTAELKTVITYVDLKVITQLQVFRIFVEIILWLLFIQNQLPVQMTFEGRNFDILTGITAIIAARYIIQNKTLMIIWNILGLLLLINIVSIALLSMPTPFRIFHNLPANTIVTYFPYVFLPTFLVPLAYILHFISLKKLLFKT